MLGAQVSRALIGMRHGLNHDWWAQLLAGSLALPLTQLTMKCAPSWRLWARRAVAVSEVCAGPVLVRCPAGCKNVIALAHPPQREGTSWPKIHCPSCGRTARCGKAVCVACGFTVPRCTCRSGCPPGRPQVQTTLDQFWGLGA